MTLERYLVSLEADLSLLSRKTHVTLRERERERDKSHKVRNDGKKMREV